MRAMMKEATSLENVLVCLLEDNEISNTIGVRIEGVNRGMSVNESDLYSLILRSRKPKAQEFRKGVGRKEAISGLDDGKGVCNVFPQWETDSLTNPASIS